MNWFTKRFDKESINRAVADGGNDRCEHVDADGSLAFSVGTESDSFGSESYITCKSCFSAAEEREGKELCHCRDCGLDKPKSETSEWTWFDFYAPQGDEAVVICKECWVLPKHKQRLADDRDHARREDEEVEARAVRRSSSRAG